MVDAVWLYTGQRKVEHRRGRNRMKIAVYEHIQVVLFRAVSQLRNAFVVSFMYCLGQEVWQSQYRWVQACWKPCAKRLVKLVIFYGYVKIGYANYRLCQVAY